MTSSEQQSEELEVLRSIFDGDQAFSITPENAVHYLFGAEGEIRSFLLEVRWPSAYPDGAIPEFNLDLFYNKHLSLVTKTELLQCLTQEAETLRGSPMTYSLIELIKDRFEQLMEKQVIQPLPADDDKGDDSDSDDSDDDATKRKSKQAKSEKLSKAQKRKQWDRGQANEERARGWNWVDVVKHLSQTGHQ